MYTGPTVLAGDSADFPIWTYGFIPSLAIGSLGVALFGLIIAPHVFYLFKKRGTRSVHLLLFLGALVEALGYGCRLSNSFHPLNGTPFILGISAIQIASILVAAAMYKSIQRGLKYWPTKTKLSPVRARSLISVFLILDSVCSVIQIIGQYLFVAAKSAEVYEAAPLMLAGTCTVVFIYGAVMQTVSLAVVTGFVIVIIRRADKDLVNADSSLQYPYLKQLLIQILVSFGLFFVRLLTRIAEGSQGLFEYASLHEWVFGVFEGLPILLILILWAVRPLHKFIFPLGYHPKDMPIEGDTPVTHNLNSSQSSSSGAVGAEAEQKV